MSIRSHGRARRIHRAAGYVLAAAAASLVFGSVNSTNAASPAPSPLAAYPGFGHDATADEATFNQEEATRENMIADCMSRKGFYYAPAASVVDDGSMTREQLYDLTLSDPNNRYTATLSPDQWEQYSLALAGVPDANDPRITSVGGCLGEAHDAVPGVYAAYNALREPYEQMQESIAADPRVVAADNEWSTCMADYGYYYESPEALSSSVDEVAFGSTTAATADADAAADSEETVDPAQTAATDATLDAATAEYEAAADVGASCETRVGLDATVDQVTVEYETAFVEQHRDVLDSYGKRG